MTEHRLSEEIRACSLCDKGALGKSTVVLGNRSSKVAVFYPHDQFGGVPDDDTMSTLSRLYFELGVDFSASFAFEPLIRCIPTKLQKRYVKCCAGFRPAEGAYTKNIVIGKTAVAHLLYDGFNPPSFKTWHGREVDREGTAYLLIASLGDVSAVFDSALDAAKFYKSGLTIAEKTIKRWASDG